MNGVAANLVMMKTKLDRNLKKKMFRKVDYLSLSTLNVSYALIQLLALSTENNYLSSYGSSINDVTVLGERGSMTL